MATRQTRTLARSMMAPSVILLLAWMIVPLVMTLWFSFLNYNLLNPGNVTFAGLFNYKYFYTDPAFFQSIWNTLVLVAGVLLITVFGGIAGERMAAWVAKNPREHRPPHEYAMETFGYTRETLLREFAGYRARFVEAAR